MVGPRAAVQHHDERTRADTAREQADPVELHVHALRYRRKAKGGSRAALAERWNDAGD